jgi:hypothetical protein
VTQSIYFDLKADNLQMKIPSRHIGLFSRGGNISVKLPKNIREEFLFERGLGFLKFQRISGFLQIDEFCHPWTPDE